MSETITESVESIEVIIVEDDNYKAESYRDEIRNDFDPTGQIVSKISIFNTDEDFIQNAGMPSANKIYIVDLILHRHTGPGAIMGKNVLNHILAGGNNPIFVRSGNRNNVEFREIFEKNPHIILHDKEATEIENFYKDLFGTIKEYYKLLNTKIEANLSIDDCLSGEGVSMLAGSSIYKIFHKNYIENNINPGDAFFIVKCFLNILPERENTITSVWGTKNATWIIKINDSQLNARTKDPTFLKKIYSKKSKIISRIILEKKRLDKKRIEVSFDVLEDIQSVVSNLELEGIYALDRWIIRYFIVYRCINLYITDKFTPGDVIEVFRKSVIFGDWQHLFERFFIFSLWEKLMLQTNGNVELVKKWLDTFHENGFPVVHDMFYCRVNEEPKDDSDFISAEVKSVATPYQPFLIEYQKSYIRKIEPWSYLKPFKLTYFHSANSFDENSCIVENILLEEFKFFEVKP